jgi:hypothetical protein
MPLLGARLHLLRRQLQGEPPAVIATGALSNPSACLSLHLRALFAVQAAAMRWAATLCRRYGASHLSFS